MLKLDINTINLEQVEALVEVTEQFVAMAEILLGQGDISKEEYESMTSLKMRFLEDVRTKYF